MDDMEHKARMVHMLTDMLKKSSADEMHKAYHPAAPVETPPVDLSAKSGEGYEDTSHSDALCKKCGKMCHGGAVMAEGGVVSPPEDEGPLCDECKGGTPVLEIDIEDKPDDEDIPAVAALRRRK
jgi:hypothetical protein